MDPTLWSAYERLCALNPEETDPAKFFTKNHPFIQTLNMALLDNNNTTHQQIMMMQQ